MKKPNLLRRITLCRARLCPFVPSSDETGCWGQCAICGERSGYVTMDAIRRYAEAHARNEAYTASEIAAGRKMVNDHRGVK